MVDVTEIKLDKEDVAKLAAMNGESLKGGKIVYANVQEDEAGEQFAVALVDYGIDGTKKFRASAYEFAVAQGEVEPRLEDLSIDALKTMSEGMGLSIAGRPNKVKLVVAIRKKLEADAKAEILAEAIADEQETEGALDDYTEAMIEATDAARAAGGELSEPPGAADIDLDESDLKKMTVDQLRELADDHGIDLPSKARKDDIVEAILAAKAGE